MMKMIYMDNSATSYPKPESVLSAVKNSLKTHFANPGRSSHKAALDTAMALYSARERVANFFNTVPERVVFVYNATYALNMALLGTIKENDTVVTSVLEHNSVLRPLYRLEREKGVKLMFLTPQKNGGNTIAEQFEKIVNSPEKPRFLAITHTSNVTGEKMPVEELGAICKREGIGFILDASQGVGTSKIDMKKLGIDILCASGHKGLFGIGGSGILVLGENTDIAISPIISGGAGILSREKEMPSTFPERLEAGTVSVVGAESVAAGIAYIESVTVEEIYHRTHTLRKFLTEGISVMKGYDLICPECDSTSIVLFNKRGISSEELSFLLDENGIASRAGLHCSPLAHEFYNTPNGALRLSLSCFNTLDECEKVLKVLKG